MHSNVLAWLMMLIASNTYANDIQCPPGSLSNGESTPELVEAWCEVMENGKVVEHGPYRAWWPNGNLGTEGQFNLGKAVGRWRGWYSSGILQGEEWFDKRVKVKSRYFNETGNEIMQAPNSLLHTDALRR
jgi:antitoxin component YwqK of YwqJK toxin-antitoxin module